MESPAFEDTSRQDIRPDPADEETVHPKMAPAEANAKDERHGLKRSIVPASTNSRLRQHPSSTRVGSVEYGHNPVAESPSSKRKRGVSAGAIVAKRKFPSR